MGGIERSECRSQAEVGQNQPGEILPVALAGGAWVPGGTNKRLGKRRLEGRKGGGSCTRMARPYPTFFCFCGVGYSSLTRNLKALRNAKHANILITNFKYKDTPFRRV